MGLDLAEVVIDIEDAFDVRIGDGWDGTVGGLVAEVLRQRKPGDGPCLSGLAFRRLAPSLALVAGRDEAAGRIRPSSLLAQWPERVLLRRWREVEIDAGLRLPERPLSLSLWLAIAAGTLGCGCAIGFAVLGGGASAAWIAGVLWLPLSLTLAWWLAPRRLPRGVGTVGDLVRASLPLNVPRLERLGATAGEREVQAVVSRIVAERLSLDLARVTPEAHFVRDLGAD